MALPTAIPDKAKPILDLIRLVETARADSSAYETIYGHNEDKLTKKITEMTIAEVQHWQPGFSRTWGSSATGAYQFMYATLGDLIKQHNVPTTAIFTPTLQDLLGYALLLRRGYQQWVEGNASSDAFMIGLAKEWASFPVPHDMQGNKRWVSRGQSYYSGDGVNKALIDPGKVWWTLENTRKGVIKPPPPPPIEPEEPDVTPPVQTIEEKVKEDVATVVRALQDPTVLTVIVSVMEKELLKSAMAAMQPYSPPPGNGVPPAKPEVVPENPPMPEVKE